MMFNYNSAARCITAPTMFKRIAMAALALFATLAVACVLGGCSSSTASADGEVIFKDSCGREVSVPSDITRVAVTGNTAQQVFLTFAPEKMVGLAVSISDSQAKYLGSSYAELPVYGQIYGGKGTLNKEALAKANPQLILDIGESKSTVSQDMDDLQAQLGIPCVHIEASLDSYDETYEMLGKLFNMTDRGKKMATYCKNAYNSTAKALSKVKDADKVKGIYVVGTDGLGVIGKGSYHATVVDMVFDNLAVFDSPSSKGTGNKVDLETIATWDPAYIVFSGDTDKDSVLNDATWQTISAISSGYYAWAPSLPYNWVVQPPSINQLLGLQWLARVIYPDMFSDSVNDIVKEYYSLFYNYDLTDAELEALL